MGKSGLWGLNLELIKIIPGYAGTYLKQGAMKLLSNLIGEIGSVVNTLSVSSKEKKQIEAELIAAVTRQEEELRRSQAAIIGTEAQGNWLQRSWRPIIMLVFAAIVLAGTFFNLPILDDTSRFWDLLEIGIGGYVIGRSAEKVAGRLKGGRK